MTGSSRASGRTSLMTSSLERFERVARQAGNFTDSSAVDLANLHPFEQRNVHPGLPSIVLELFDSSHYSQATFEAFKFLDKEVQRHSCCSESGVKLMMSVFAATSPLLRLNALSTTSEKDEQKGFQFVFAGAVLAIRNPRGHEVAVADSPDECLDHLALASLLLRRLEDAGFRCAAL